MSSVESIAETYVEHQVVSEDIDRWRRAQVPDQPYRFLVSIRVRGIPLVGFIHAFQSKESVTTEEEVKVKPKGIEGLVGSMGIETTVILTTFSEGADTVGVGALEIPLVSRGDSPLLRVMAARNTEQFPAMESVFEHWKALGITDRVHNTFVTTEYRGPDQDALYLTNLSRDGKPLKEVLELNDRLLVSAIVIADTIPCNELGMTIVPQDFPS
jgi:hypothetical protein